MLGKCHSNGIMQWRKGVRENGKTIKSQINKINPTKQPQSGQI
jgi:hypothetical protein